MPLSEMNAEKRKHMDRRCRLHPLLLDLSDSNASRRVSAVIQLSKILKEEDTRFAIYLNELTPDQFALLRDNSRGNVEWTCNESIRTTWAQIARSYLKYCVIELDSVVFGGKRTASARSASRTKNKGKRADKPKFIANMKAIYDEVKHISFLVETVRETFAFLCKTLFTLTSVDPDNVNIDSCHNFLQMVLSKAEYVAAIDTNDIVATMRFLMKRANQRAQMTDPEGRLFRALAETAREHDLTPIVEEFLASLAGDVDLAFLAAGYEQHPMIAQSIVSSALQIYMHHGIDFYTQSTSSLRNLTRIVRRLWNTKMIRESVLFFRICQRLNVDVNEDLVEIICGNERMRGEIDAEAAVGLGGRMREHLIPKGSTRSGQLEKGGHLSHEYLDLVCILVLWARDHERVWRARIGSRMGDGSSTMSLVEFYSQLLWERAIEEAIFFHGLHSLLLTRLDMFSKEEDLVFILTAITSHIERNSSADGDFGLVYWCLRCLQLILVLFSRKADSECKAARSMCNEAVTACIPLLERGAETISDAAYDTLSLVSILDPELGLRLKERLLDAPVFHSSTSPNPVLVSQNKVSLNALEFAAVVVMQVGLTREKRLTVLGSAFHAISSLNRSTASQAALRDCSSDSLEKEKWFTERLSSSVSQLVFPHWDETFVERLLGRLLSRDSEDRRGGRLAGLGEQALYIEETALPNMTEAAVAAHFLPRKRLAQDLSQLIDSCRDAIHSRIAQTGESVPDDAVAHTILHEATNCAENDIWKAIRCLHVLTTLPESVGPSDEGGSSPSRQLLERVAAALDAGTPHLALVVPILLPATVLDQTMLERVKAGCVAAMTFSELNVICELSKEFFSLSLGLKVAIGVGISDLVENVEAVSRNSAEMREWLSENTPEGSIHIFRGAFAEMRLRSLTSQVEQIVRRSGNLTGPLGANVEILADRMTTMLTDMAKEKYGPLDSQKLGRMLRAASLLLFSTRSVTSGFAERIQALHLVLETAGAYRPVVDVEGKEALYSFVSESIRYSPLPKLSDWGIEFFFSLLQGRDFFLRRRCACSLDILLKEFSSTADICRDVVEIVSEKSQLHVLPDLLGVSPPEKTLQGGEIEFQVTGFHALSSLIPVSPEVELAVLCEFTKLFEVSSKESNVSKALTEIVAALPAQLECESPKQLFVENCPDITIFWMQQGELCEFPFELFGFSSQEEFSGSSIPATVPYAGIAVREGETAADGFARVMTASGMKIGGIFEKHFPAIFSRILPLYHTDRAVAEEMYALLIANIGESGLNSLIRDSLDEILLSMIELVDVDQEQPDSKEGPSFSFSFRRYTRKCAAPIVLKSLKYYAELLKCERLADVFASPKERLVGIIAHLSSRVQATRRPARKRERLRRFSFFVDILFGETGAETASRDHTSKSDESAEASIVDAEAGTYILYLLLHTAILLHEDYHSIEAVRLLRRLLEMALARGHVDTLRSVARRLGAHLREKTEIEGISAEVSGGLREILADLRATLYEHGHTKEALLVPLVPELPAEGTSIDASFPNKISRRDPEVEFYELIEEICGANGSSDVAKRAIVRIGGLLRVEEWREEVRRSTAEDLRPRPAARILRAFYEMSGIVTGCGRRGARDDELQESFSLFAEFVMTVSGNSILELALMGDEAIEGFAAGVASMRPDIDFFSGMRKRILLKLLDSLTATDSQVRIESYLSLSLLLKTKMGVATHNSLRASSKESDLFAMTLLDCFLHRSKGGQKQSLRRNQHNQLLLGRVRKLRRRLPLPTGELKRVSELLQEDRDEYSYEEWLAAVTEAVAEAITSDDFFRAVGRLAGLSRRGASARGQTPFLEEVFPYLIVDVLCSSTQDGEIDFQLPEESETIIEYIVYAFNNLLGRSNASSRKKALILDSIEAIRRYSLWKSLVAEDEGKSVLWSADTFMVEMIGRVQRAKTRKRKRLGVRDPSPEFDLLAATKAAVEAERPEMAAMLIELHVERISAGGGEGKGTLSVGHFTRLARERGDLVDSVYRALDDPDAIYAIADTVCSKSVAAKLEKERKWFASLVASEAAVNTADGSNVEYESQREEATGRIIRSLMGFGAFSIAESYMAGLESSGEIAEDIAKYKCKCSWRLGEWGTASGEASIPHAAVPSFDMTVLRALRALNMGHKSLIAPITKSGVRSVASKISSKRFGVRRTGRWLVRLHTIHRLREMGEVGEVGDVAKMIPQKEVLYGCGNEHVDLIHAVAQALSIVRSPTSIETLQAYLLLARVARRAGEAAVSDIALRRLEQLEETSPHGTRDLAVLWRLERGKNFLSRGEKANCVLMAEDALERCRTYNEEMSPATRARAFRIAGRWRIETRMESFKTIMDKYLKEAARIVQEEGVEDGGKAFLELATFANAALAAKLETKAGREARRVSELHKRREERLLVLELQLKNAGVNMNDQRLLERDMRRLRDQVEAYRVEKEEEERERAHLLETAATGYIECLTRAGEYRLRSAPRLLTLWFSNMRNRRITSLLMDKFDEIPSYIMVPYIYQIASRLGMGTSSTGNEEFSLVLTKMLVRMASMHPHHCLWPLLALRNGKLLPPRQRHREIYCADEEKIAAAAALLDSLRRTDVDSKEDLGGILVEMERLMEGYVELAYLDCKKHKEQGNSRNIQLTKRLKGVTDLTKIPIATNTLAIRPGGGYEGQFAHVVRFYEKFSLPGGITIPKKIRCVGSDGKEYSQLVKSEDDLRQDAVMQQMYSTMNHLFKQNEKTRKRNLNLRGYRVVPLTPTCGVIEWVDNAIAFGSYLTRNTVTSAGTVLAAAHERYRPNDKKHAEVRKAFQAVHKGTLEHRLFMFRKLSATFKPVFHHFFLERFPDAREWISRRCSYVRSVSSNSIAGYCIGLGDRHTMNILVDVSTAECVHIDLGVAFDQGKQLQTPECVPFRLTRNVVDGFGVAGVEGMFRRCCEFAMEVIRENRESLITIAEVLVHDPLYKWSLDSVKALKYQRMREYSGNDDLFAEDEEEIINSMSIFASESKVEETSWGFTNAEAEQTILALRGKLTGYYGGREILSVSGQVQELINEARDDENLSRMYYG